MCHFCQVSDAILYGGTDAIPAFISLLNFHLSASHWMYYRRYKRLYEVIILLISYPTPCIGMVFKINVRLGLAHHLRPLHDVFALDSSSLKSQTLSG